MKFPTVMETQALRWEQILNTTRMFNVNFHTFIHVHLGILRGGRGKVEYCRNPRAWQLLRIAVTHSHGRESLCFLGDGSGSFLRGM